MPVAKDETGWGDGSYGHNSCAASVTHTHRKWMSTAWRNYGFLCIEPPGLQRSSLSACPATLRSALLPECTQGPPQGTKPVPMHSCCTHHGCPAGAAWVLSVLVHHLCTLQHSPAPTALAMGARMGRLLGSPPCTRAHLAAPVNIAWA